MPDPFSMPSRHDAPATTSVLDRNVSITGTITSDGAIRIEGTVEGDVQARSVTLSEGATITGSVAADVAVIEGRLIGPLQAREARLSSSAHMEGDVVHSILIVEAGAHFEGRCRRDSGARQMAPANETKAEKTKEAAE